jgi:hypothetical protein
MYLHKINVTSQLYAPADFNPVEVSSCSYLVADWVDPTASPGTERILVSAGNRTPDIRPVSSHIIHLTAVADSIGMHNASAVFNSNDLHWHESILNWWSVVLLDKLVVAQLIRKFPVCYRDRRFITMFKIACRTKKIPEPDESSSHLSILFV